MDAVIFPYKFDYVMNGGNNAMLINVMPLKRDNVMKKNMEEKCKQVLGNDTIYNELNP